MNSYEQVMADFAKTVGLTNAQRVVALAEETLGWPYVWGASGVACAPAKRQYYAGRDVCPDGEKQEIKRTCPVLSGSQSLCAGCKWLPNGDYVLINDCQGWIKWLMNKIGITLTGGGCTSMYYNTSLWSAQGDIKDMPDTVCCVFKRNKSDKHTMEHIGLHIGGGRIIHCSGTVKRGSVNESSSLPWSHYAIPKGMEGSEVWRTTIRKGSSGEDVKYCQELLMKLGYDLGKYGADGKFGAVTQEAVKAFQKKSGLNQDGVVGPMTWDALEKAGGSVETLYTVSIKHLDKTQMEAMRTAYPDCVVTEE